jgi:protein involved in plasmid replication-relaxation
MLLEYPQLAWNQLEDRAKVSELTLRHELAVLDVKTEFSRAIRNISHYELVEFSTWPLLYQFRAAQPPLPGTYQPASVLIKPDGFVRLHEQATDGDRFEHFVFLEVDRSTEPRETLARRVYGYQDFYRRGGLALRHGFTREDYKDFPFRVLMVLPNEERRNNMAERLLQNEPPALTMVWLITFPEITADPLGAIWMRPLDYRDITKGTQYDPSRPRTGAYRREPAREAMVTTELKKLRLFEES